MPTTALACNQCRHCRAPLPPPLRAGGHCGAAACRWREDLARWAWRTQQLGEPAVQAGEARLPPGRRAKLLWLGEAPEHLAPVPATRRAAHRAHLQALVEAAPTEGMPQPLAEPPPAASGGAQEGRLCGQCRGRCCAEGAPNHAFITLPQLLRWQQREPGRTLQQAVDWYMAQVPERHTRRGCIYQGPRGCVLQRADRADICNRYACDALVQLQQALQEEPQAAFVAVTLAGDRVLRRGLITAETTRRL